MGVNEPFWVEVRDAIAIHDRQIVVHGGLPGIRDECLLESAIARPKNMLAYGTPDLFDLAAAYAFAIAKNHSFVDGNKRTSLAVCLAFLDINGFGLPLADDENIAIWEALAAGTISEAQLAIWLRTRARTVINEISGEGETVQIELIEDTPVPVVQADGCEFEELVGNVLYLSLYKEHIRDDGKIIRETVSRLSTTVDVFFKLVKMIDEAKPRKEPNE